MYVPQILAIIILILDWTRTRQSGKLQIKSTELLVTLAHSKQIEHLISFSWDILISIKRFSR